MYKDRMEAAEKLTGIALKFKGREGVVFTIPRGGVPIGYHLARALGLQLEMSLIKKIGHPQNKEFAIGAVNENDRVLNPVTGVDEEYVESETKRLQEMIRENQKRFRGARAHAAVSGKDVIITDDGMATGNTMLATVQLIRKKAPASVTIAVPVVPPQTLKALEKKADEVICPLRPSGFEAVGQYYRNFEQVTDEEVIGLLQEAEMKDD